MDKKHPTAFVSYSWDSPEHEAWVHRFVNNLREKGGVDATFDKFELQGRTVNLYSMMALGFRDKDFVIIVLTENYAKKADSEEGGVGFESILTLPLLQINKDKLIFVMRHTGDFSRVFPFHLTGFYAIDFSDDECFNEKFNELLHRIHGVDLYEKAPLGPIPELKPKKNPEFFSEDSLSTLAGIQIPNLKKITDIDKIQFMEKSFREICSLLKTLLLQVRRTNPNFEFTIEEITSKKVLMRVFLDGELKTAIKIWLGGSFGGREEQINLNFGTVIDTLSDNCINEIIACNVKEDNKMELRMTMNIHGNKEGHDAQSIVREIWEQHISHYLK